LLLFAFWFFAAALTSQQPEERKLRDRRDEPYAECRPAVSGWTTCEAKRVWTERGSQKVEWSVATPGGEFRLRGLSITFRAIGDVELTLIARGREVLVER
jgi:hypothetical protein